MAFFSELRRRKVLQVAAAYIALAWVLLQVAELALQSWGLPDEALRYVWIAAILGFPVAAIFGWRYDITSRGIVRTPAAGQRETADLSLHRSDYLILTVLLLATGAIVVNFGRAILGSPRESSPVGPLDVLPNSVAVIPFVSIGDDPESELFAAGIHDDLLTQLAKIADLNVISRTSVREYAATTKNLRQIGAELGVQTILEGGVQKVGGRIRLNAQLIDAETDKHLWAESFDRELTARNIFDIQSELARSIAGALHATLAPGTASAIAKVQTDNLEAYRDYLAGLQVLVHDLDVRRQLLQSAVEKDPQFALAWVRLADVWQQTFWWDPAEQLGALDESVEALRRAEEIDPDLPEIHLVRARQHYHGYLDYEAALAELEQAEQGLPGSAEVFEWRGNIYRRMDGGMPEALAAHAHWFRLNPRDPLAIWEYSNTLQFARRYEEARALRESAITMFPEVVVWRRVRAEVDFNQYGDASGVVRVLLRPDWPKDEERYHEQVAHNAWLADEIETAVQHAERIVTDRLSTRWFFRTREELTGAILEAAGETERARQMFAVALARTAEAVAEQPQDATRLQALARVQAFLGKDEAAIRSANEALEHFDQRDVLGFRGFRAAHGQILCHAGDLQAAEGEFRWVLSRLNPFTLASLINSWPPCKARYAGTEQHQRLQQEFGHLSAGVAARATAP